MDRGAGEGKGGRDKGGNEGGDGKGGEETEGIAGPPTFPCLPPPYDCYYYE